MLDTYWSIKSHGSWFRVSAATVAECLDFINSQRKAAIRDTTMLPTFFEFIDLTGGIIHLDIKSISSIHESSPEIRRRDKEQVDWLNNKEFPEF